MSWPCLGLRLLLLVTGAAGEPTEEKKPVPLYTNEDLDRVSSQRDQTGVSSSVAVPAEPAPSRDPGDGARARSEAYWRREAGRLQDRLRPVRERIEDLRARIAERESQPAARSLSRRAAPGREATLDAWRRQLAALEARVRETEARFEDRARRAGALPGWLR
jgi:hypothetical protein